MTTYLPRLELPAEDDSEEAVATGATSDDVLAAVSAAGAALGVGLTLSVVLHIIALGWMPFVSFIWFVAIYAVLVFLRQSGPAVRDRFWTVILWAAGFVVVAALALVIGFVLIRGWNVFTDIFSPTVHQTFWQRLHFFTQDMSGVGPLDGLDRGGIVFALIGTLIQIGIALLFTIPLGLATAVFLSEIGGRFARIVRTVVEAMTALPSVVAGLFIYAAIIVAFTHQNSGFAASLALTVLMLPIMIRSADVVLRLVPGNLREAGQALGAGQWATVWYVVLPTVRSGLTTAIILATAHGIGETAPVLLTSGVTSYTNFDPFHNPMTSLPLAALQFMEAPQPALKERGFATAAFLLVVVLVLFAVARWLAGSDNGTLTGARSARIARRSRRSEARVGRSLRRRVVRRAESAASDIPSSDLPDWLKELP